MNCAFNRIRFTLLIAMAALCALGAACHADIRTAPPETWELTVHPRATTRPALANSLLPMGLDRTPGDAAPLYYQAFSLLDSLPILQTLTPEERRKYGLSEDDSAFRLADVFEDSPLEKMPLALADQHLAACQMTFALLDLAATREDCHWQLPVREYGFRTIVPDLNLMRALTTLNIVRMRVRLARDDFGGAVRCLRAQFAAVRNLNDQPFLVSALVSVGLSCQPLPTLRDMLQMKDAPNLYWPLAALPNPLTDMHAAIDFERLAMHAEFPELDKAREGKLNASELYQFIRHAVTDASEMTEIQPERAQTFEDLLKPLRIVWLISQLESPARRYLVAHGKDAKRVAELSAFGAIGAYLAISLDDSYDEMIKLSSLPFWQVKPDAWDSAYVRCPIPGTFAAKNPLSAFIPTVSRAVYQSAKAQRYYAALQTVEAIRAYAATHDGNLPKRLEDIVDTPVPIDPVHGTLFKYTVHGRTATIESAAPPDEYPREGLIVHMKVLEH